jgi:hypothetical protein
MSAGRGLCGLATVPFARASDRVVARLVASGVGVTTWRGGGHLGRIRRGLLESLALVVVEARRCTDRGRGELLESLARSTSTPPWCGAGLAPVRTASGRVWPRWVGAGYAVGARAGGRGDVRDRARSWSGVSSVPLWSCPDLSARAAIRSRRSS